MKEYVEGFIQFLKSDKKMAENTVLSYRRDIDRIVEFFDKQGFDSWSKINETSVNSYILSLEKEGKSVSSILRCVSSMRAYFKYLRKMGVVKDDPAENIVLPKLEKKAPAVISEETINKILDIPNGQDPKSIRDKAMLELLYATGLKVTELVKLKAADVNIQMSFVICRTNKKKRMIPFGQKTKQALVNYLTKARPSLVVGDVDTLFVNCLGKEMTRQGFWKILKEYVREAGIKGEISPHVIRHSFGAHLIENGADVESVQQMMGHVDIASTNRYVGYKEKNLRDVYNNAHPRA